MKRLLLLMAAVMLCLCGCKQETAQKKKFVMATNATFPPYEYIDKGKIDGIDPEIIRRISQRLGYELEIQDMAFDGVIAAVQSGKAQVAASGITVTEDRKQKVFFTDPYVTATQVMIVPKNSTIKGEADLKGKRIGVQHGTTGDSYVKENFHEPQRFQHGPDAVTALVNGKLDVVVIDGEPAEAYISKNPGLKILPKPLVLEEYAFAISKDNKKLLDAFNAELRKMKASGELDNLINSYRKPRLSVYCPDSEEGKYFGAVMDQVGTKLGYKVDIQPGGPESVLSSVQSDRKQIVSASYLLTEYQKKLIPNTSTVVVGEYVLVIPEKSDVKAFADLKGKKIGVLKHSFAERYVENSFGASVGFENESVILSELAAGKMDAAVVEKKIAQAFAAKNGAVRIYPETFAREEYALYAGADSEDLLKEFVSEWQKLQRSGELNKMLAAAEQSLIPTKTVVENQSAERMQGDSFWEGIKFSFYNNFVKDNRYMYLLDGFLVTIKITVLAVLMGIVIGFGVAVVRSTADLTGRMKLLDGLCRVYLTVIRGTPVVVQLLIIYFVIFGSVDVDKVLVAVIAFGINSGAYVAEIIRGGIMSIDKGQMEAGQSLGLTYGQTMREIILPQAFKNVLPALGNEFIVLLKETSVAGYIALQDLTRGGDIIRSQTYDAFFPLIAVALIYLVVVMFLSWLLGRLEKRLKRNE